MGSGSSTTVRASSPDPESVAQLKSHSGKVSEAIGGLLKVAVFATVNATLNAIAAGTSRADLESTVAADPQVSGTSGAVVNTVAAIVYELACYGADELAAILTSPDAKALIGRIGRAVWNRITGRAGAYGGYALAKGGCGQGTTTGGGYAYGYTGNSVTGGACCTGGGCPYVGGVDGSTVIKYAGSPASDIKKKLVDDIIKFARSEGAKISGNTPDEQLGSYLTHLKSAGAGTKSCDAIAQFINDAYGSKIILPGPPADVCERIYEVLHSLRAGLHSEFLTVYEDVRMIIENLSGLQKLIRKNNKLLRSEVNQAQGVARQQLETIIDLNDAVLVECDRQLAMLNGLLNIRLMKKSDALDALLGKGDLKSILDKVKQSPSAKNISMFTDVLRRSLVLSGTVAARVDEALKEVGVTLEQYRATDTMSKLDDMLTKAVLDRGDKRFEDVMNAVTFLKQAWMDRDAITTTGGCDSCGKNEVTGGAGIADLGLFYTPADGDADKTEMEKRKIAYERARDLIMDSFYRAINERFTAFVGALNVFSDKLGRAAGASGSEQLTELMQLLDRINNTIVYDTTLYYNLAGYFSDDMNRQKRDQFIGSLRAVLNQVQAMVGLPEFSSTAQFLRDIKSAGDAIIDTVNKYATSIEARFGKSMPIATGSAHGGNIGGPVAIPNAGTEFSPSFGGDDHDNLDIAEISGGATNFSGSYDTLPPMGPIGAEIYGANEDAIYGGADGADKHVFAVTGGAAPSMRMKYRTPRAITDAITKFKYNLAGAKILANIAAMRSDLPEFGKNVDELNANAIVTVQRKRAAQFTFMRDELAKVTPDALKPAFGGDAALAAAEIKAAGDILEFQWRASKGFWAAAESMDKCLRTFTDVVTRDPLAIGDVHKILDSLDVVTEWYDTRTGNILASIFENFPAGLPAPGVWANGATWPHGSGYVDDNEFNHGRGGAHYYDWVAGANAANVGNPYLHVGPKLGQTAINGARAYMRSMDALKNLFSVLIHAGRAAGSAVASQQMMSPAQMCAAVTNLIIASAFTQGCALGDITTDGTHPAPEWDSTDVTGAAVVNGVAVNVGMAANAIGADPVSLFAKRFGVHMVGVGQSAMLSATDGVSFDLENRYFVYMLKACAAKVLTITGIHGMLNRPLELAPGVTSPIRMILGGADETPTVDSAAVELYLRLPLLAHWYRDLFGWGKDSDFRTHSGFTMKDDQIKISMVPDIEGTFAPLIRLIFRELQNTETGSYTDDDVRKIVREVNLIWQKHSSAGVRGVITQFVNEISRRYGIVTKQSQEAYAADFGRLAGKFDPAAATPTDYADPVEFALLPGEDGDEPTRLTPSQRIIGEVPLRSLKHKDLSLAPNHYQLVERFRCQIDKLLETPGTSTPAFASAIKSTQNDLKSEQSPQKRLQLVAELVRGTDLSSRVDGLKYAMFGETVIGGLNALSAIYTQLYRFRSRVLVFSTLNLKLEFIAYLKTLVAAGTAPTRAGFIGHINGKYTGPDTHIRVDGALVDKVIRANVAVGDEGATAAAPLFGPNSVYDLIANIPLVKLEQLVLKPQCPATDQPLKQRVNHFFRLLLNRQVIMRELLESVHAVSAEGLAKVAYGDSRITVTFGDLEATVRDLFGSVAYFLNVLGPRMDKQLVASYSDLANPGSFYYLQKHLLEQIIVGRDGRDSRTKYRNLGDLSRAIADTFVDITSKSESVANPLAISGVVNATSYFGLFAASAYYDARDINSGVAAGPADLQSYTTDPYEALMAAGPADKKTLDLRWIGRFKQLYSWDASGLKDSRSLLFAFNQLVAKYIGTFFDVSTSKIYTGLIDKLANGTFARAVGEPWKAAYPDTIPAVQVKYVGPVQHSVPQYQMIGERFGADFVTVTNAITTEFNNAIAASNEADAAAWISTVGQRGRAAGNPFATNVMNAIGALAVAPTPTIGDFDAAFAANPFATNMLGATGIDRDTRMRTFAATLLLAAQHNGGVAPPTAATIQAIANELRQSTYNVPVGASQGPAKYMIAGDDLLAIDATNPGRGGVIPGAATASTLVYAREGPLNGGPADTLNGLAPVTKVANTDTSGALGSQLAFGSRADPTSETVLFSSLAVTLRNLLTSKTPTGAAVYASDNIADVPHHMKERMRANLPAFRRLFGELIKRAEFLKTVLAMKPIDVTRAAAPGLRNPWPYVLKAPVQATSDNKNRINGIIDEIIAGATTLIAACTQVLREVGDDPKFLEIQQNSIREYAASNGVNPFMPLTSSLAVLANGNRLALPTHTLGEDTFKLAYGLRGLLDPSTKPSMDNTPGFADVVAQYNMLVSGQYIVDGGKAAEYLGNYTRALRYVNAQRERAMLSAWWAQAWSGANLTETHMNATFAGNTYAAKSIALLTNVPDNARTRVSRVVYALEKDISDVVRLTESSQRKERIADYATWVWTPSAGTSDQLAVQNILDLDIVPINVHALMREIPFATTFNYAYTFDRMVIELMYGAGVAPEHIKRLCASECEDATGIEIESAKDALVALLINPYLSFADHGASTSRDSAAALKHVENMLLGTTGMEGLARPKFLADEIYGKAIFGEQYCEPGFYAEAGPAAGKVASDVMNADYWEHIAVQFASAALFNNAAWANVNAAPVLTRTITMLVRYFFKNPRKSFESALAQLRSDGHIAAGGALAGVIAAGGDESWAQFALTIACLIAVDFTRDIIAAARDGTTAAGINNAIAIAWRNIDGALGAIALGQSHVGLIAFLGGVGTESATALLSKIGPGQISKHVTPAPGVINAYNLGGVPAWATDIATRASARVNSQYPQSKYPSATVHNARNLHYIVPAKDGQDDTDDAGRVKTIPIGNAAAHLAIIGALRFDTKLVRDTVFIVNLLRCLRLRLSQDLHYGKGPIVRANVAPRLTEMFGNQTAPSEYRKLQ